MPIALSEHLSRRLSELPLHPGVYLMKDSRGKIIYIGKAKVLKNRVRSYFDGSEHSGHRAATLMLPYIKDIEWIITESEQDALILEATLVRKYRPRYNVDLKDDKHFPYLAVNLKEAFPRFTIVRAIKNKGFQYFGPYMNTRIIRHLTDLSASLFKIRECSLNLSKKNSLRPCLNYHLGRCSAPCAGLISEEDYEKNLREAILLIDGKRSDLLLQVEREMISASEKCDFENAAKKRDLLMALRATSIVQKSDSADPSLKLDAIAIRRHDNMATAVVLEYRAGVFSGRRHYQLECTLEEDDEEIYRQFLSRLYLGEETLQEIPPEILLENSLGESKELFERALSKSAGRKVLLSVPQRGEKLGFLKLASANAEMLLVEMRAEAMRYEDVNRSVFELQQIIGLKKAPFRIECVDISHLSGTNTVASLVAFKNGRPDKSNYRKFIIRTVNGIDDFACMREVLSRRIRRLEEEKKELPDLWVCDGGKGQVEATYSILKELGHADLPLIGLAKRLEEIVFPGERKSIVLPRTNPALKLLQNARDEAHRFAITYQRSKRTASFRVQWLDVPGVGRETRMKILSKYRSREEFLSAPQEDIEILLGKKRGEQLREAIAQKAQMESN